MSRLAFKDWCEKHLRNIRLQKVMEEQSEHDSWEYISEKGQISKASQFFDMELRQFKFASIKSGKGARSRYSGIKLGLICEKASCPLGASKMVPLKKLSSTLRKDKELIRFSLKERLQNNGQYEEEKKGSNSMSMSVKESLVSDSSLGSLVS